MLEINEESVIYQSETKLLEIAYEVASTRNYKKEEAQVKIKEGFNIYKALQALEYKIYLSQEQRQKIVFCLIKQAGIQDFPVAPVLGNTTAPTIVTGIPGPPGTPGTNGTNGATGPQGATGLATDFSETLSVTGVVDSFDIDDAKAARWDYHVVNAGGAQRASSIVAHWLPDGSDFGIDDSGAPELGGATSGIEFDLQYVAGNIELVATITSGVWVITGSRYFIPNNGNGSGPVSAVLPDGTVYIGNASNTAQSRTLSGAITTTNTGVTSLTAGTVVNASVSASAAISLSKLAALSNNFLLVSNGSGVISTSSVTATEASYLSGATSNIQTQITGKLTDPTTTVGDIIIRNGANNIARLGIGSSTQVLTVSGGVPTWQNPSGGISGLTTGYIPKASSSTTVNDSVISQSGSAVNIAGTLEIFSGIRTQTTGSYYKIKTLDIGDWNMDTSVNAFVTHGVTNWETIRVLDIQIRQDSVSTLNRPLSSQTDDAAGTAGAINGGVAAISSTTITLNRSTGGVFDNSGYNQTSYNRGWVIIIYE